MLNYFLAPVFVVANTPTSLFSQHPIQVHEQQQFEKAQEKAQGLLSTVPIPSPNRTLSEKTQELSAEDRATFLREGNHLLVRIIPSHNHTIMC